MVGAADDSVWAFCGFFSGQMSFSSEVERRFWLCSEVIGLGLVGVEVALQGFDKLGIIMIFIIFPYQCFHVLVLILNHLFYDVEVFRGKTGGTNRDP